jgi:SAM-dependent methyltransferase
MSDYRFQNETNKAGEVTYRKMVADQEKDDPNSLIPTMKERMKETLQVFHGLEEKYNLHITKDMIFGEFGAERAQRMLAIMDKYDLTKAYAFDISPDMLKLSGMISELCFTKKEGNGKLPHERLTLVADDFLKAKQNIQPEQLDFVFCFATIHHFPDPRPVFKTAYSLLKDGGYFYFDREALRSWLGFHEVARFRYYLMHGKIIERDYGILETQFSLKTWLEAINTFEDWDVRLKYPAPVLEHIYNMSLHSITDNALLRTMAQLSGGRMHGLLRKKARLARA